MDIIEILKYNDYNEGLFYPLNTGTILNLKCV